MNIKTDGCSYVPEFHLHERCNQHDIDYATIGKFKADFRLLTGSWSDSRKLKKWYNRALGKIVTVAYYLGVTFFGWFAYYKAQKYKPSNI